MSIIYAILGSIFWVTLFELLKSYSENNVQKDNYGRMKQRLVKLLQKDGYQNEMNEGRIVLTYRQERFVVHFDASQFGDQYARVTIADYYIVEGMDEVHPFVMDAVMGRATHNSIRTPNIAYDESCRFTDRPALSFPGKLTQLLYERFRLGLRGLGRSGMQFADVGGFYHGTLVLLQNGKELFIGHQHLGSGVFHHEFQALRRV